MPPCVPARSASRPLAVAAVLFAAVAASASCKQRTFNADAKARSVPAPSAGALAFPKDPRYRNAHEVCRRLDEANSERAVNECVAIIGASQAFTSHGVNACYGLIAGPAGSDWKAGRTPAIANHVLDCLRGSSNRMVTPKQVESCSKDRTLTEEKALTGKCLDGRLDPYDCLEGFGQCLASSSAEATYEDSVDVKVALGMLPKVLEALEAGNAKALDEAVQPLLAAGVETKPPLNDQGGKPYGYREGDAPVRFEFPSWSKDPDVAKSALFVQADALAFCTANAANEDCLRTVVNHEFSRADLEMCASGTLRSRAVSCLVAVRQVHRKGHMRRAKLRDDVTSMIGRLQEDGDGLAKAKAIVADLEEKLRAASN